MDYNLDLPKVKTNYGSYAGQPTAISFGQDKVEQAMSRCSDQLLTEYEKQNIEINLINTVIIFI